VATVWATSTIIAACRFGPVFRQVGARRLSIDSFDRAPGEFLGFGLRDHRGLGPSDRSISVAVCLLGPGLGDGQPFLVADQYCGELLSFGVDRRLDVGQLGRQPVSPGLGLGQGLASLVESRTELLAQRRGLLSGGVGLAALGLGAPLRLLSPAGASRGGRHLLGRLTRYGFDL
jgi:hypothetical protein